MDTYLIFEYDLQLGEITKFLGTYTTDDITEHYRDSAFKIIDEPVKFSRVFFNGHTLNAKVLYSHAFQTPQPVVAWVNVKEPYLD